MKRAHYLLFSLFLLFTGKIFAGTNEDVTPGLEVSFLLSDQNDFVNKYMIYIYKNGEIDDSVEIKRKNPVYMLLELNSYYCLRIVKPGFKDRMVLVDTSVPKEKETEIFHFDFEIEMLDRQEPANTLDDLPVAYLKFNPSKENFNYSEKYAESICHQPGISKPKRW
jgi:hypothetical protein